MKKNSNGTILIKRFLKDFFIKYWKKELLVFLMIVIDSVFIMIIPYLNKILIDNVFTAKHYEYFYLVLGSMLGAYIVQLCIRVVKDMMFFKIGEKVLIDIRLKLVNHVLTLPVAFFSKMTNGKLISRVENDVTVLQQVASSAFMELIGNVIDLIFVLCIMCCMNIKLTVVSILIMGCYSFASKYFADHTRNKSKEKLNAASNNMSYLSEAFSSIVTIKLFNEESWAYGKLKNLYDTYYKKSIGLWKFQILNMNTTFLLSIIATGALWIIGGIEIINGTMTLGALIAFQSYQSQLFSPLRLFSNLNSQIQSATASLERIYRVLDQEPEKIEGNSGVTEINGKIDFKNVSFSYDKSKKVLNDMNFSIKPGEFVAFVGKSGCGKSTIFNLLTRLYTNNEGDITIDDVDINEIDLRVLRKNISIIPQEIQMFNMSIYDNLTLGIEDATFEDVKRYAEKVDMAEYIESLPDKYDTILEENGKNLSGGQRKRLGIVRSMLKKSKILIIDEAMNALDNERKQMVREIIEEMRGECTILFISHQLKDLNQVEKIFVIENGTVSDCGSHEELMNHNYMYEELYTKEIS